MTVGPQEVFFIFLFIILIISVALGVFPVIAGITHNKCIAQQHTLLNSFERKIEYVKQKGVPMTNDPFLVMDCTECIWYDALESQWIIKHTKEEQINKSISYNVLGVAANCINCNNPSMDIDGDGEPEKCANMVKGHTYDFEVGEDYVKCTNCPDSPNSCEYQILFGPRVEVVDDPSDAESIALASYENILYLFYHKEGTNDIYYKTSIDGKNWNDPEKLTDSAHPYGYPSVGVFNNELYVAYSGDLGCFGIGCSGWEIFIKKFDGTTWTDVGMLMNDDNLDKGSFFATYKGRLYIFYYHGKYSILYDKTLSEIRYRVCESNCGLLSNWGPEMKATDWGSAGEHTYPSALEYDGKLYMSYSANVGVAGDDRWEIFYKTCDDANGNSLCDDSEWSSYEPVTDNSAIDEHSHLIFYDNRLYIFYHEKSSDDYSRVLYKAYDGGWQRECGAAGGQKPNFAGYPAITIHSDKIKLCYIKYDVDWKIVCQ